MILSDNRWSTTVGTGLRPDLGIGPAVGGLDADGDAILDPGLVRANQTRVVAWPFSILMTIHWRCLLSILNSISSSS